jgi:hypothetical protein
MTRGLLLAAAVLIGACEDSLGPQVTTWVPDSAAVLAHVSVSGIETATALVIGDSSVWSRRWQEISSHLQTGPRPLPAVDFTTHSVILAAMGSEPNSVYGISIDSVVLHLRGDGPLAVVHVTEVGNCQSDSPGPTSPIHIVAVPLRVSLWRWQRRSFVSSC